MNNIKDHLGLHANALQLREKRNLLLASNMANSATPNYKARDFDFASELKKAAAAGEMTTSNGRHFGSGSADGLGMLYRQPVNPSLDGNTVELAVEQPNGVLNAIEEAVSTLREVSRVLSRRRAAMGEKLKQDRQIRLVYSRGAPHDAV